MCLVMGINQTFTDYLVQNSDHSSSSYSSQRLNKSSQQQAVRSYYRSDIKYAALIAPSHLYLVTDI